MLFALAALTIVRPPKTPGPYARDFEAYYAGGAAWLAGGDPYSRDVWRTERTIGGVTATRDEVLPFVGPASFLPLWAAFARLPFVPASIVWSVLLAVAFAVLIAAALALARAPSDPQFRAAAVLAVLVAGPTLSDFALGQAALVAAAAVALALGGLERGAGWAPCAAFVAAIQPNVTLPLAAALTTRRALFAALAAFAAFALAALAFGGGIAGVVAYAKLLGAHGAAERFVSIQHTLPVVFASFGMPRGLARLAGDAAGAFAVAAATAAAVAFRDRPARSAAIAIALLPLGLPFFHEHDFVIAAIPLLLLLADRDPRVRTLAACAGVAVFVDWFGLAQRPPANAQIALLALAVALALTACSARGALQPRDAAPLATAICLLLIALPLAHAAPAPTWPDALAADFRVPGDASASAAWAAEQAASGLDRDVAAWGVLRAIPLAGCLALAAGNGLAGLRCRRS